jgi:hypothetical protein
MNDTPCWMIDWRDYFRDGSKRWNPYEGGEMRGFHVVFCLEMHERGRLVFWDDDGSIIRRNGQIIHEDRSAHSLMQSSVDVAAGDVLEIAQWQLGWDWQWCAVMEKELAHRQGALEPFRAYRGRVKAQLQHPTGPPLKIYTNGSHPLRAIAAVYSMVLNGYTPSSILLFGEEQWSEQSRALFTELLPFCLVFPRQSALEHIRQFGGAQLVEINGDFTNWIPVPLLPAAGDKWSVSVLMKSGKYQMNMRVDGGQWIVPPGLLSMADEFGGTVGLLVIE